MLALFRNKRFQEAAARGILYPSAKVRYDGSPVDCDRCKRVDIQSCVGHGDIDLCPHCVASIKDTIPIAPLTRMASVDYSAEDESEDTLKEVSEKFTPNDQYDENTTSVLKEVMEKIKWGSKTRMMLSDYR